MGDGPLILVVDDELDARESVRDLLEYEGYTVALAADGREAMDRLDALDGKFCLVLLDLYMPVMNGWEFVEKLRGDGRERKIKVIITTSAPHHAPSGFPVVSKPLDAEKLLALVKSHCP